MQRKTKINNNKYARATSYKILWHNHGTLTMLKVKINLSSSFSSSLHAADDDAQKHCNKIIFKSQLRFISQTWIFFVRCHWKFFLLKIKISPRIFSKTSNSLKNFFPYFQSMINEHYIWGFSSVFCLYVFIIFHSSIHTYLLTYLVTLCTAWYPISNIFNFIVLRMNGRDMDRN